MISFKTEKESCELLHHISYGFHEQFLRLSVNTFFTDIYAQCYFIILSWAVIFVPYINVYIYDELSLVHQLKDWMIQIEW